MGFLKANAKTIVLIVVVVAICALAARKTGVGQSLFRTNPS